MKIHFWNNVEDYDASREQLIDALHKERIGSAIMCVGMLAVIMAAILGTGIYSQGQQDEQKALQAAPAVCQVK